MRNQHMMGDLDRRLPALDTRSVPAEQMAVDGDAPGLIERDPMLDQTVEFTEHRSGELHKSVDGRPVLPAALLLQRLGQLPVVEGAEGLDAVVEQRCHEFFVILEP
ncbi:hypothetical protein D3C73_731510 [compost metagenome]